MPWKRRPFASSNLSDALNIADLREIARQRLPGFVFEYIEGGAEDEATLRCNRQSLESLRLIPQTLVDTSDRQQRIELFDRTSTAPLIIGPTGMNGLIDPEGDILLARGAAALGIPYTLSTVSTTKLEDVAAQVGGRLWMQLYVLKDRTIAEDIMRRAAAAGYEALVFTTDANVFGNREWDRRCYGASGKPRLRTIVDALRHPRWVMDVVRNGMPRFRNIEAFLPAGTSAVGATRLVPQYFKPTITWNDISWIRRLWPGKLLIKGILSTSDAQRAAELGCDGIILTNHGGRQLDHCVAPIDVLPEIVTAVGKRLTIIVDSGFRRGTDVVKALALGAHAIMLGRAPLYGLAAGGEAGVHKALKVMTNEIDRVLGHLGCRSIGELGPHLLRRG
jgi:(S)-mandelate dehydrogenase